MHNKKKNPTQTSTNLENWLQITSLKPLDRKVILCDAKTYKRVFTCKLGKFSAGIGGVGFSPSSSRLVTASSLFSLSSVGIWDIATCKLVIGPLRHEGWASAAKYSPRGDRIATATPNSVRVYDGNDGRLLVDIPVQVTPCYNTGLIWSEEQLFVISGSKIKQIDASTGSALSEWPVPGSSVYASIVALPLHAFIAYSTNSTVTFWDMATHAQLGCIQHPQDIDIHSIAISPDQHLAIVGKNGKLSIKSLCHIAVSVVYCCTGRTWIQSNCLVYTTLSRNQTFISTMLCSIYGSRISSPTRKHY